MLNEAEITRRLDAFIGSVDPDDPRGRKRLRLIEVATALFSERGYRKTSVDDIAEWAGVAKGTVYLHFRTKLDILLAAISLEKKQFLHRLEPVFDTSLPARTRLRHWLINVFTLAREMPLTGRLMAGDQELVAVIREFPPELVQEQEALRLTMMGELIDEAARPHRFTEMEIEDRVKVLAGLAHCAGMIANPEVRSGMPLDRFAAILVDTIIAGLGGTAGGPQQGAST